MIGMTKEEKKAIGQLIWYKQLFNNGYCKDCNELCSSGASIPSIDLANSIATVLNLIQRQDRQIDLMADTILEDTLKLDTYWCNGCSKTIDCPYKNPKDCIKQYFVEQKEV